MDFRITDYNGAQELFANSCAKLWKEVETAVKELALHVKASDQAGRQGNLIFNPVGTNQALKESLERKKWNYLQLPDEYSSFGLGIDFEKNGVCIEAQFSNYPFLLNNILRAEVLFRDLVHFRELHQISGIIMITKAKHFPSSNSTLHYEQAIEHLNGLDKRKIFTIPTRLVGLDVIDSTTEAVLTKYSQSRYSRTVKKTREVTVCLERSPRGGASKFKLGR